MYYFMVLRRAIASIFPFLFSILGVVRAQELSDQLTPFLVPFFDVVTLVLGKRVDTISMFYLLVILSIFVFMILYTALKKSNVFGDTFTSSSVEAGLAILITLLVIRFMPFAYFFFMLLAFLIIAVILSIRLLYGLVADEEHKFGAISGLFVISIGIMLLGSLILLFGTEISSAGIEFPPEVRTIASVIIFIGVIFFIITIFLGIYSARGTVKSAWKDIKAAEREEQGEERARGRKRFRFAGAEVKEIKASIKALVIEAKRLKKLAGKFNGRGAAQYAERADQIAEYTIRLEESLIAKINQRNSLKRQNPDRDTKGVDANIRNLERKIETYLSEIRIMDDQLQQAKHRRGVSARTRPKKAKARTRTRKTTRRTARRRRR